MLNSTQEVHIHTLNATRAVQFPTHSARIDDAVGSAFRCFSALDHVPAQHMVHMNNDKNRAVGHCSSGDRRLNDVL